MEECQAFLERDSDGLIRWSCKRDGCKSSSFWHMPDDELKVKMYLKNQRSGCKPGRSPFFDDMERLWAKHEEYENGGK